MFQVMSEIARPCPRRVRICQTKFVCCSVHFIANRELLSQITFLKTAQSVSLAFGAEYSKSMWELQHHCENSGFREIVSLPRLKKSYLNFLKVSWGPLLDTSRFWNIKDVPKEEFLKQSELRAGVTKRDVKNQWSGLGPPSVEWNKGIPPLCITNVQENWLWWNIELELCAHPLIGALYACT